MRLDLFFKKKRIPLFDDRSNEIDKMEWNQTEPKKQQQKSALRAHFL